MVFFGTFASTVCCGRFSEPILVPPHRALEPRGEVSRPIYHGQPAKAEVFERMRGLGFRPSWDLEEVPGARRA